MLCETNGGKLVTPFKEITTAVVEPFRTPHRGSLSNDAGGRCSGQLAGVEAGATMVQGTMNGYGERNGNANLTTIIPNLEIKMDIKTNSGQHLSKLRDLSLFIDDATNFRPDIRSPYVGAASFAHKGGVHADAASKSNRSYEHIDPSIVGNRTRVLVSDMSGRSSVMMKAKEMGMNVDGRSPEMKSFLEELKRLEFQGYEFEAADASFDLLLRRFLRGENFAFEVLRYHVGVGREAGGNQSTSEATVKLKIKDEERHTVAEGNGPVSALDHALRNALEKDFPYIQEVRLTDFKVRILESNLGTDAITRVHIESTDGNKTWGTVGVSDNAHHRKLGSTGRFGFLQNPLGFPERFVSFDPRAQGGPDLSVGRAEDDVRGYAQGCRQMSWARIVPKKYRSLLNHHLPKFTQACRTNHSNPPVFDNLEFFKTRPNLFICLSKGKSHFVHGL